MRLWAEFPCGSTHPKKDHVENKLCSLCHSSGDYGNAKITQHALKVSELFHIIEDVPLVEFMYLVFTRMSGEHHRRRLKSLLLCLCDVFQAIINSLVCWFFQILTEIGHYTEEEGENVGHFQIIIEIGHYTEEEEEEDIENIDHFQIITETGHYTEEEEEEEEIGHLQIIIETEHYTEEEDIGHPQIIIEIGHHTEEEEDTGHL